MCISHSSMLFSALTVWLLTLCTLFIKLSLNRQFFKKKTSPRCFFVSYQTQVITLRTGKCHKIPQKTQLNKSNIFFLFLSVKFWKLFSEKYHFKSCRPVISDDCNRSWHHFKTRQAKKKPTIKKSEIYVKYFLISEQNFSGFWFRTRFND